jgi:hypothetical protein
MPESHEVTDREQVGRFGFRHCGRDVDAQLLGGAAQDRHVADRLGGGDEQQPLGAGSQRPDPGLESVLELSGDRLLAAVLQLARELGRRQGPGQLEQCERVAPRLGQDPVADPRFETPRGHRGDERAGIAVPEAPDLLLRQPVHRMVGDGVPQREQQQDALGKEAPRDEGEGLGRDVVEPLDVVDQADQRVGIRDIGEDAEHGQPDEEPVRRVSRT